MEALSLFRNYKDVQPTAVTLEAVVETIRSDVSLKTLTEGFRASQRHELKESSPLFAVACRFSGGKAQGHVQSLTGLSLVDVDDVADGERLEQLFQTAVADAHTLMSYRTISGHGLRIIFAYELDAAYNLKQQRQYYAKAYSVGNAYYARLLGVDPDGKCKNVTRLSGMAYDPQVYLNLQAEPFSQQWIDSQWQPVVSSQQLAKRAARERARIQARYDQTIRQEVEAEGGVYAPGSHNDYVMRVGYKLNQFGFSRDVAVEWAAQSFPEYDRTADVVASCYDTQQAEHGIRDGTRKHHHAGSDALPWATVSDIQTFLTDHVRLRHNVITNRVECWDDKPRHALIRSDDGDQDRWQPISDHKLNTLWTEMSETFRVKYEHMERVVMSDYVPDYNPFLEYLERVAGGVSEGDSGEGAIRQLAATVTVTGGDDEQQLFYEYLRKWLVGMVAAWLDPLVANNVILVLIGEQGTYKTTWFNYLLPPCLRRYFYTKTNAQRMGRDDLLTLAQYGLICCEELDTMRPSELNQLKAAVTMSSIDERAAYAHFHEHRPHIASFCGTGNNVQFLSDPTGNRRWLPFEVVSIISPREHPFDYDAIYREAFALYRSGFQYWFSRDEILRLAEHNSHFETPWLEREMLQQYFRKPVGQERGEFVSTGHALEIIGGNRNLELNKVSLGRAFVNLGFQPAVHQHTRGYLVVQRSPEEIKAIRRMIACDVSETGPDDEPF